jgi:hypothetical protein
LEKGTAQAFYADLKALMAVEGRDHRVDRSRGAALARELSELSDPEDGESAVARKRCIVAASFLVSLRIGPTK